MEVALFVSECPEFSIKNGVACVRITTGDRAMCLHLPLLQFRMAVSRGRRTLVEHDAAGEVVAFPGH